ncbi:serine/threonine-protein kinase [Actinoplanes sandaracinus]|uniref:serine/threonine-protein kinase n=1 Tax=Actinoplanes sandaracinus TaxID=3045177 RepID=UPI0038991882
MAVRQMLVADRYRLLEPVGAGGMGRVWLARDEMLHRDVAVKEIVPPDWMTDAEQDRLRERTLREARSAARLNHPHVVRIYDVVHAEGLSWIVMEYVQSRSLHQVLNEDGPYDPATAARIGLAVLDALDAAHQAGVLHRDVKPHNVLIGVDGRVVLTDFGLATFVDDGSVTTPGLIVGSPQYVSPERARDGASTVESDLWSLGATLYAAVEGRSPYARESAMATLAALATEAPDPPSRAGPLAPVLGGLLRYDPATRLTVPEIERRLRMIVFSDPREIPFLPSQRDTRRNRPEEPRRPSDPVVLSHRSGPVPATGGPEPVREGVVPAASGGSGAGGTVRSGGPPRGTAAVDSRFSPPFRQPPEPPKSPAAPDRASSSPQSAPSQPAVPRLADRPRPPAGAATERASPHPSPGREGERLSPGREGERLSPGREGERLSPRRGEERPSPRPSRRTGRSTPAVMGSESDRAEPRPGSPLSEARRPEPVAPGSGSGELLPVLPGLPPAGPDRSGSVAVSSAVGPDSAGSIAAAPEHPMDARPAEPGPDAPGNRLEPAGDPPGTDLERREPLQGATSCLAGGEPSGREHRLAEDTGAGSLAFVGDTGKGASASPGTDGAEDTDPLPADPEEPETTRLPRPAGQQALVPVLSVVGATGPGRWPHWRGMSRRSASMRLTQARLAVAALVLLVIGGTLLAGYVAEVNRPRPQVFIPSPSSIQPSGERPAPSAAGPVPTPPPSGQTGPAGDTGPSAGPVGSAAQPAASGGSPAGHGPSPESPYGTAPSTAPSSATSPGVESSGFAPALCESPPRAGLPVTPLKGAPRGVNGWKLQPGWSYFDDGAGFHIAVPDGWTHQRVGGTYCFRSPGNARVMSLHTGRDPAVDPLTASRAEEQRLATSGDLPGYALIGIASVPLLHKAADWEYRYHARGGAARRAGIRWFVIDGRAYALGWSTPEKTWNSDLGKIQMIRSTFYSNRPAPSR